MMSALSIKNLPIVLLVLTFLKNQNDATIAGLLNIINLPTQVSRGDHHGIIITVKRSLLNHFMQES